MERMGSRAQDAGELNLHVFKTIRPVPRLFIRVA
jgi:hypothetical protein